MDAPFRDEGFDIWVLGNRLDRYPRFTAVFEIHDDLSEHGPAYMEWLENKCEGIELITGANFPFDEAKELFGSTYLTSSSAYMMALAILRGYERIEIYGVDMAVDDHEYFWQRPCMEAWIGFAKGRGINVVIHDKSPVLRSDYIEGKGCGGKPDFSLPPFTQAAFLELADVHSNKIQAAIDQIKQIEKIIQTHDGCRQTYERLAKVARAVEAGQKVSLTDSVVIK